MARRAQAAALPLRPALAPRPDAEPGSPTAAPPEPPPRAAAGADLPRRGPGRRRARRGAARAPHPSRAGALRSGPRPEAPPTRRGPAQPLRALRAAGSPGPPGYAGRLAPGLSAPEPAPPAPRAACSSRTSSPPWATQQAPDRDRKAVHTRLPSRTLRPQPLLLLHLCSLALSAGWSLGSQPSPKLAPDPIPGLHC
nr:atherin-like isoform X2 [Manis javanica]